MSNKNNKNYLYLIAKKAISNYDHFVEVSKIYATAIADANCWNCEYAVNMINMIDKLIILKKQIDFLSQKEINTISEMQQRITRCCLTRSSKSSKSSISEDLFSTDELKDDLEPTTNTKQKKRRIVRKKTTVEE
jgi:hypothetical protein